MRKKIAHILLYQFIFFAVYGTDTLVKTKNNAIQKGIKLYLGINSGIEILHLKNLWEIAAYKYRDIYYSNPSSFQNLRDKTNLYYYSLHTNINLDFQVRWLILRKSFYGRLYNFSQNFISYSRGYNSSSFYGYYMWLGYSNRYKNKNYYFTLLKGSPVLSIISLIVTYHIFPNLVNGKNIYSEDAIVSDPYPLKDLDVTGIGILGTGDFYSSIRSIVNSWYLDFGKKIKRNWYVGVYIYFHGLRPYITSVGECSPGSCNLDLLAIGATRFIGVNVYYLFSKKK